MKKKYFFSLFLLFVAGLFSHSVMAQTPAPVYTSEPDLLFDGTTTPIKIPTNEANTILNAEAVTIAIEYTLAEADLKKAGKMAFTGANSNWGYTYYEAILAMFQSNPGVGVRFDDYGDDTGLLPCSIIGENKKIVFVLTNTELSVYLDGTLVQTKEGCFTFNNCSRDLDAAGLFIGGLLDINGSIHYQFKGTIHSLRYYDEALNETEVKSLFGETKKTFIINNTQSTGGKVEMFVDGATTPTEWGSKVFEGSQVTFKASAYFGYKLASLSINGEEVNAVDGVYTTTVNEAMTVSATFTYKTVYVITLDVSHSSSSTVRIYDADGNRYYSEDEIFEETDVKLIFDIKNNETVQSLTEGNSSVELKDLIVNNEYAIGKLTKSLTFHVTFTDPNAIDKVNADEPTIRYENGQLYNHAGEISIYNLTGKLLYHTNKEVIDVTNWANGIYIVRGTGKTIKFAK